MTERSFTLAVHSASYLPTVLSGIALRVQNFTVENHSHTFGGWLIQINKLSQAATSSLLDNLPGHMVSVHEIKE